MSTPIAMKGRIQNVTFGENVKSVEPVNLYGCSIGDDCFIGPFMEIRKDVVIGAGAVATKNIEKPGVYGGNPARLHELF